MASVVGRIVLKLVPGLCVAMVACGLAFAAGCNGDLSQEAKPVAAPAEAPPAVTAPAEAPATAAAPAEAPPAAGAKERLILDTDLGDDVDDAGTLAVMHALADRGEIEILAVGIVNGHVDAVPLAHAINTWYGRPDVPIGTIARKDAPINHDRFKMGQVAAAYPHVLTQATAPDVVGLYRKVLAAQPDRSVTLVTVGQATNIANLLKSKPDEHSPLDGVELVRRKIKFYGAGGNGRARLPNGQAGWNYQNDRQSALYELEHLPSDFPTVFAGGSGLKILVGSCYRDAPADHIVRRLYENYFKGTAKDRPTWDQMRLLYAVRPSFRERFDRSPNGSVTMNAENGHITWQAEPNRNHSYAYVKEGEQNAVAEELKELMMHMPSKEPPQ